MIRYTVPLLLCCAAGLVAADATAPAAAAAAGGKVDIISAGLFHWPMLPLWLISVVLVALLFERLRALREGRIIDQTMIDDVTACMGDGDVAGARERAEASDTVLGKAWAQALHEFELGGVGLSDALMDATLLAFKPLKRNLTAITTVGVISPLFGLFATVIGIIISFGQMGAEGGADKAELAKAIGIALFGTAGGILLAIPAIVMGRWFHSRVVGFAERAEAAIHRLNYVFARSKEGTVAAPAALSE